MKTFVIQSCSPSTLFDPLAAPAAAPVLVPPPNTPPRAPPTALFRIVAMLFLSWMRRRIYFDLILDSLGEAARQALGNMNVRTYEYRSDFARHYFAQGKAELILELLTVRFGPLGEEIESRIQGASIPDLRLIGTRLLTARTLEEALG